MFFADNNLKEEMMVDHIPLREVPRARTAQADEDRRMRRLRVTVDLAAAILRQQTPLSETEARALIAAARASVLRLFPESEVTFDLILAPRFQRILGERGIGSDELP